MARLFCPTKDQNFHPLHPQRLTYLGGGFSVVLSGSLGSSSLSLSSYKKRWRTGGENIKLLKERIPQKGEPRQEGEGKGGRTDIKAGRKAGSTKCEGGKHQWVYYRHHKTLLECGALTQATLKGPPPPTFFYCPVNIQLLAHFLLRLLARFIFITRRTIVYQKCI